MSMDKDIMRLAITFAGATLLVCLVIMGVLAVRLDGAVANNIVDVIGKIALGLAACIAALGGSHALAAARIAAPAPVPAPLPPVTTP